MEINIRIYDPSPEIKQMLANMIKRDTKELDRDGGDIVTYFAPKEFCSPLVDPPQVKITDYPNPCGEINL